MKAADTFRLSPGLMWRSDAACSELLLFFP